MQPEKHAPRVHGRLENQSQPTKQGHQQRCDEESEKKCEKGRQMRGQSSPWTPERMVLQGRETTEGRVVPGWRGKGWGEAGLRRWGQRARCGAVMGGRLRSGLGFERDLS